jgi:putative transposase
VKEHLGVDLEIVQHPWIGVRGPWNKGEWDKIIPKGFHLLPRRWVVERTNAWLTHNRRLSRDFEGTHSSSEAFIYLAMTGLMLSRLTRDRP